MSEVQNTPELRRILSLPRRSLTPDDIASLVEQLTELLRTEQGEQRLRPVQALALHDIGIVGGGFLPVGVGEGKTLISLLVSYVLDAKRPLLLLPASLIEKTHRERAKATEQWLVPNHIRLFSYDMLGRAQSACELETYKPDLIICDEVHRLKNRRAACTRRVSRWMHEHPETRFVGMSGTIMRKSLHDFAHILRWALKDQAPVPKTEQEVDEWASALDEPNPGVPGAELTQLEPGALLELCPGLEPTTENARRGFRSRLVETPGVVATAGEAERVDCSLYIRAHVLKVQPITEQHFATLRGAWETPDGWPLSQGVDVWRHARELALGFHYVRVDKDGYKQWLASVRRSGRSRLVGTEQRISKDCEHSTGRERPSETLQRRGTEFSRLDTGLTAPSGNAYSTSGAGVAGSAARGGAGFASTTATRPAECEDFSVCLAIEQSDVSATMSKEYRERFGTFLESARPPKPWLDARKDWSQFVRAILANSRTLDSELQVAHAVSTGKLDDCGALARWQDIKESFRSITVPVWHDDSALKHCADWSRKGPGIIWTEHVYFSACLSAYAGIPYFGESGFSADGTYIEDAPAGPIIASIRANKDGKNLQYKWRRNLIVSPPEGWDVWQQAIARTHRPGQAADDVEVDVIWSCREHVNAWHKAWAGTLAARDTVGSDEVLPKLLLADVSLPDTSKLSGPRWRNI